MRSDWQTRRLADVLRIQNGYAFDSKAFNSSKGVPLVRIRDLKAGNETETRYAGDYDDKYLVNTGDLLVGMDGEFGCYEWRGGSALLNQRVCRIEGFTDLVPRFLFYGLNSYLKAIEDITGYTTVKHLSAKQILDIEFPIPPLSEQQRIVAILDQVFDGIGAAKVSVVRNLQNAHVLFDNYLQSVFAQPGKRWVERTLGEVARQFGRGKSKHRPRGDTRLLGGKYPLIQTGDIANANRRITAFSQTYNEMGLSQSKLWPRDTVCIAIVGANVAETAILNFDACFPDSVIGLVVNERVAIPEYVQFVLSAFKSILKGKGKGTARDNINIRTFESQRFPFPDVAEQKRVVLKLNALAAETEELQGVYRQKIEAFEALKASLVHQAFSGELTKYLPRAAVLPFPTKVPGITTTDLHAGILALAYAKHDAAGTSRSFGHVKAEKIAHMVESHLGINLGRQPIKDAAGPNDYRHLLAVEHRARKAGYFDFKRVKGAGYRVKKLRQFDALVERTQTALGSHSSAVDKLVSLMLPMTTQQAEIFATVYAAWNNLLLEGKRLTDEEIVFEARENWHPDKLKIPREKFFKAIAWLMEKGVVPTRSGKKVVAKTAV